MVMDIVERLRMKGPMSFQMDWSDRANAADEIEQMRFKHKEMVSKLQWVVKEYNNLLIEYRELLSKKSGKE